MSAADLDHTETYRALHRAFSEEAALTLRYLYYATIAEFEGLDKQAGLFRELAEGSIVSAQGCLDYLTTARDPESQIPVGETFRNLQSLLQTETQQFNQLHPERARLARKEGFTDVASWFETLEKLKRSRALRLRGQETAREADGKATEAGS